MSATQPLTKAQLIDQIASLKVTYDQEKREYEAALKFQATGNSQSSEVGLTDPDETTGKIIKDLEAELARRFPTGGRRRRKTSRHRRKHRKTLRRK